MPRKLRFVPHVRTLIAITCRTVQGRFLFRPGPQLNEIVLGVLGRAQRRYETTIAAFSVLSSHLHVLLVVDSARDASNFMRYTKSKLAREVNRLTGWRGPVFDRRYEMTVVTDEEAAQAGILKYVLAQSVKEDLVERVSEWPGVHCAGALIDGTPLEGHWFSRTQEFAARLRGEDFGRMRYATAETVTLSPIPCWARLSPEIYRARIVSLVESIETEAALARERTGASVLGAEAVLSRDPQHRPAFLARSPAPRVHAATKAARRAFYEIYAAFVSAFREASERLRAGDCNAPFPIGSFPPALPFVTG
ncbi:MAG TPA: transposase [Thermoanaerobaculia bacterium]|nr:transposase [Thermoanaerobaculia bacterium]